MLTTFIVSVLKRAPKKLRTSPLLLKIYRSIFQRKFSLIEKNIFNKLREIERCDLEEVKNIQEAMLLNILSYAYENTDYYKSLFDNNAINLNSIETLKTIPILNKESIRNNTDSLISKTTPKATLSLLNTGGSTGKPLEFYSNTNAGAIDNAHHWYLYHLMGYEKNDVIIGCGGHTIPLKLRRSNVFWKKNDKNCVWGEVSFSVLYLTDTTIPYYIDKLMEIEPSILRGYPSFYAHLAQYILDKNIKLSFKVKGINLTAEMCSVSQRNTIEKAFSSQVYFEYGHTEMCLYCYTVDNSYIYKSSAIYGYIEVLDDNGNDVAIGEVGKVIVTGFNNHGMPFIRYDTGDMGEICYRNGGIVHFKKIVGRNQDYIITQDSQKVYLTALIFGQHLHAFKNIVQWQIVQNVVGSVKIQIIKGEFYTLDDEMEVRKNFESVGGISVTFKYVKSIPLTKRGKHLFLIQNIK